MRAVALTPSPGGTLPGPPAGTMTRFQSSGPAHMPKRTAFRWGLCFQPAVRIKYYTMSTLTTVLEAGLWLRCRKKQRWRQQCKLSRASDRSEHKSMEDTGVWGGGRNHSKIQCIII